jgi:hypothetical protein
MYSQHEAKFHTFVTSALGCERRCKQQVSSKPWHPTTKRSDVTSRKPEDTHCREKLKSTHSVSISKTGRLMLLHVSNIARNPVWWHERCICDISFNEKLLCSERCVMPAFVWTKLQCLRKAYLSIQLHNWVRMHIHSFINGSTTLRWALAYSSVS